MKNWILLICCCNVLNAKPYIKRFWKPIIFKEEKDETFDRRKLIHIEEGEYNYGEGLPEAPKTIETVVSAGNVTANNVSFIQQELSADNVIKYLKEEPTAKKKKVNIDNVYITPVRKIHVQ